MNTELQSWLSCSVDCAGGKQPYILVFNGSKPQVLVAPEGSSKAEALVTR